MADGVLVDLITKALESLGRSGFKKAASWWGARDELKNLENSMRMIQARVRDAECRQEHANSEAIKEWLRRLKLVLYRVDDLFDEVLTLDSQKQQVDRSTLAKVGILFSKFGPIYYNRKLANEIKSIKEELDAIKSDMAGLNLSVLVAEELQQPINRLIKKRETSSAVNTEDIIGRENDQNMIIEMLFDPKYDGEKITVIPIVGFGGLGKTTLAQLVFNNERVKKHFDLIRWAYVPEIDNKVVIMGKIFKSFTDENYDNLSLEQIQQGIKRSIGTKKYLLVLDDLWDEGVDRLIDLVNLLKCGKHESKVIVTTRSDVVAKIVGTIDVPHKLGTLTHDQSWELFKKFAFKPGKEDSNPTLSAIGKEIVKMCGNVPLAIKVFGGSLRSRDIEKEWLEVRDAQCSKAQLTKGNDIMAILKISYDYLPPTLKQCFAYCSLFPKGSLLKKNDLVHLWLAQGYIEPSNEDIGDQYFSELLARNFFQNPEVFYEGIVKRCQMHDLLHDLAQKVAGDEILLLGDESPIQIRDGLTHVSLNGSTCPPSLIIATKMRSLLCISNHANPEGLISRFRSLRALSLKHIQYKKLPNSLARLIHLRYLNLGMNEIEYLPDFITRLWNLQTLNLESCQKLKELPRDFAKLANLRHLLLSEWWTLLTDLPSEFGKLTSLQELNRFIVGKSNGIDSLPALKLRGEVNIKFRKWRRDAILEAEKANLNYNHHMTSLHLDLNFVEEEATPAFVEMNKMLTCLQLPPNLKYLTVGGYKGDEMPGRWLDGLSKLVSICITDCVNCKVLPHLSQLPHLKSLKFEHLDDLEYIEDEDNIKVGTAAHNMYFPSLEVLVLWNCSNLKGWTRASMDNGVQRQLVYSRLLKLKVDECPMLMSMPLAPKLESLDVRKINGKVFESNLTSNNDDKALSSLSINSMCNLNELKIRCCRELRSLRFEYPNSVRKLHISGCSRLRNVSEGLQHLSVLETLHINRCEELETDEEEEEEGKSSSSWQGLKSLRELYIWSIPKMKKLPRGIAFLTTLQELSLEYMQNLTELPEEIGNLSLLRHLQILKCPKLKSLPTSIQGLTSLQSLHIKKCPDLEIRYKKPDGEDFRLIQHIPYVLISFISALQLPNEIFQLEPNSQS